MSVTLGTLTPLCGYPTPQPQAAWDLFSVLWGRLSVTQTVRLSALQSRWSISRKTETRLCWAGGPAFPFAPSVYVSVYTG